MEMGSWSLFQAPSLLALIPLVVYIVMVFRGKDNTSGIIVGIALGAIMMGQNLQMLSKAFAASLGSTTALIGVIIMTGAGLGVLMTETRVTHTLVYWIVKRIGVNTQTKAKIALIVCSILICGLLGTLGGGNAVIAPILIPVMASLGVTPTVVAALFKISGEIGLMVGPL
ncbi:MAG TPA: C4-dicarboxylate ABC transporter permease, partial [Ruminococcaceae bacterium]|nr:C4-dicarboxylate ABC transporter permease [Oscillospiraceae bacterium]